MFSLQGLRRCCRRARGEEQGWNSDWWLEHLRDRVGDTGMVVMIRPLADLSDYLRRSIKLTHDDRIVMVHWKNRAMKPKSTYCNAWATMYGASWLRVL